MPREISGNLSDRACGNGRYARWSPCLHNTGGEGGRIPPSSSHSGEEKEQREMIHELEVHFFVTGWRFPYDFEKFIFTQAFCFFVKRKKTPREDPSGSWGISYLYRRLARGLIIKTPRLVLFPPAWLVHVSCFFLSHKHFILFCFFPVSYCYFYFSAHPISLTFWFVPDAMQPIVDLQL